MNIYPSQCYNCLIHLLGIVLPNFRYWKNITGTAEIHKTPLPSTCYAVNTLGMINLISPVQRKNIAYLLGTYWKMTSNLIKACKRTIIQKEVYKTAKSSCSCYCSYYGYVFLSFLLLVSGTQYHFQLEVTVHLLMMTPAVF